MTELRMAKGYHLHDDNTASRLNSAFYFFKRVFYTLHIFALSLSLRGRWGRVCLTRQSRKGGAGQTVWPR